RGNTLKRMDFREYCWIEGYGYEYYILDGGAYYLSSVEDEDGVLIERSKDWECYNPMVVEGYSWNVVYTGADDGDDIETFHTYTERIEGDSILNGIIYKKLWEAYDANWENKRFLALIREDIIEQKIFAYNDGAEVLLYDLGVDVGDTIRVFNWLRHLKYVNSFNIKEKEENLSCLVVEKIEFIEDDKYGKLKKITYYVADVDYPLKTIIYERYGSTTGWAITNHAVIDGGGPGKMICAFDEMGEVVYKRKYTIRGYGEVKDCYINAEVGTNVNLPKKKESVYYNSQDRTLRVDFERDEKIEIYNAMGKRVMRKKINEGCKSINCNLNAGVYIVTVKNSNTHTKIVVK
ncbi:MAG: T9SS type A sorting domain-containing protein, partial [Paludibacteraceae bacterium]|nr:T9SS type A sorting domain-containing protein [Paludibacteraceae bacterium]